MTDFKNRFSRIDTNLVHAGSPRPNIEGAVVTPIFQSANYLMGDEVSYDEIKYIRLNNSPNHSSLHARLAAIESGEAGLVTGSGMSAITTAVLTFAGNGDHVLAHDTLYGGTQSFFEADLQKFGIDFDTIDLTDSNTTVSWKEKLKSRTRVLYVESITNPLMQVGYLKQAVQFAREHNLISIIDNTFATPVNFRPLEIGFDIVIHSATKYLNGHSDIVAGAIVSSAENIAKINHLHVHLGGALDPHACFLLERGMKTLALRVGRQNESALKLAEHLDSLPTVKRVNYAGLPADSGHAVASSLFTGYGGMLSFYTDSDRRADSFVRKTRVATRAASLGGLETLVVRPAFSSHLAQSRESREAIGVTDNLVRVSVGIEHIDELLADFEQALTD